MRHGAILRSIMFYFWSQAKEEVLASTLLQLDPSDLLFRELAFGIFCLASGGKHMTAIRKSKLSNNSAFGLLKTNGPVEDAEFFSVLGSGAHRAGEKPGVAPQETIYWFEGVLVVLTAQLYRDGACKRATQYVAKYCEVNHAEMVVDAVVLSIEHLIMVHIIPSSKGSGPEVQYTNLLPLFEIPEHLTMHAAERYTESYLSQHLDPNNEKFQKRLRRKQREATSERMIKNEGINMQFGKDEDDSDDGDEEEELLLPTQVEGSNLETFHALAHLFSSAARRRLQPDQQGRFSTEIYERILSFVMDNETRDACLHASLVLRDICMREYLVSESAGLLLRPSVSCEGIVDAGAIPKWWNMLDMNTGEESKVDCKRGGCSFLDWDTGDDWTVMVGHGYGKKSLIPEITLKFPRHSGDTSE